MLSTSLTLFLHTLLFFLVLPSSALSSPHPHGRTSKQAQSIGKIQTKPLIVHKPRSSSLLQRTRLQSLQHSKCLSREEGRLEWDAVQVQGPDVEDRYTLAQLARMAGDAYALPGQRNWYEVDQAWNTSFPFGWEEDDGFRGRVFLSSDNNTVILSIKGTTLQGPTSRLDKFNDNLLFSCCCARVDISWVFRTVCDCYANRWRCDNQCLTDALIQDSLFYSVGTKLVDDVLRIYPTANLWLVGHSLGGALASLLGATYGLPAVAFESPGERLAAQRLHLPLPPAISDASNVTTSTSSPSAFFPIPRPPRPPPPASPLSSSITHVYHTADPIPFGTCSGLYSPCASAGYALETRCHLGKSIILDTVDKLGWLVNVQKHVIKEIVRLLDIPPEGSEEEGVEWGEHDSDDGDDDGGADDDLLWLRVKSEVSSALNWNRWTSPKGWWGWGPGRDRGGPEKKKKGKKGKKGDGDNNGGKKSISNRVPKAVIEDDCTDCHKWEFGDFKEERGGGVRRNG